ncbi:Fc receptor-like protein 3 [Ammospiza caudacuta]|uniref:Fc receptor-like protein 3 n=1 Tax=Ammospiza caudacuta TaxID=2857398 RepID=UPI00273A4794|nr:Fc receptor-like protein 3 [Ammospiza caudacuta]
MGVPGMGSGWSRQPGERWPQQRVTASAHGWGHWDGREAQTLGLAGAQTTQLLVEPPWRPAVLWDRVTLTCQGSGTAGATIWYKDGQRWGQERRDHFTVTESGTYTCERPGTGLSSPVRVSDDWLVLQVPAWVLLEGDTLTLRCRGWWNNTVTSVSFYRKGKELRELRDSIKLSLSPLQLSQSGKYSCRGWVGFWGLQESPQSAPVTVTVHELFSVPVLEGPFKPILGSPLPPSCISTPSPLRPRAPLLHVFYRDGQVVGGPQGSPQLLVPAMGVSHSGNYSCQVRSEGGAVRKSSAWIHITVRTVANATIIPGHLSHQIYAGDNVTLHCSVQVGSAPVTFTWLHNGQQVARGPLLELRDIDVGHSGTYQCVATNQFGQDGHRVFQAFSPELALEVTPGSPWVTVAAGVGGALLFLLPLVAVIVTWHRRHRVAARKSQERAPPDPLAPPEEGEVLYTHVVVTKRARVSPRATTLQDPQVTYVELRGPQGRLQEPGDIYGNVL